MTHTIMQKPDFALLWQEECDVLFTLAQKVPEGGVILEIGTALGGSGVIFDQATQGKDISIYSVDIAPSARAYKHLQKTAVNIVPLSSSKFADQWERDGARSIDLLFIDGDHRFQFLYEDFCRWMPYVRPEGVVLFHDYDPPERGGLAHFAIRIFLDTIVRMGLLNSPRHRFRLLVASKNVSSVAPPSLRDCFETMVTIGNDILQQRAKVFSGSISEGIERLQQRTVSCDSVQLCYCIEYALKHDFERLDCQTTSRGEFRRWTEILSMFEYGVGQSVFPDSIQAISPLQSLEEFSQMIAREQVRLHILSQIARTIVEWKL